MISIKIPSALNILTKVLQKNFTAYTKILVFFFFFNILNVLETCLINFLR